MYATLPAAGALAREPNVTCCFADVKPRSEGRRLAPHGGSDAAYAEGWPEAHGLPTLESLPSLALFAPLVLDLGFVFLLVRGLLGLRAAGDCDLGALL